MRTSLNEFHNSITNDQTGVKHIMIKKDEQLGDQGNK